MLFWILAGALAAGTAALIARPLLASSRDLPDASPDLAVYKDQLAEVDRDVARGVLGSEEAERARTEIARRLLSADRAGPARMAQAPRAWALGGAGAAAVVAVGGSLALYAEIGAPGARDLPRAGRIEAARVAYAGRPSQAEAEAQAPRIDLSAEVPAQELALIEELRARVPERPEDLRGWELLTRNEARLGRFAAAARAQERVVALKGEEAGPDDLARLLDMMVAAAGGFTVSPEAELALRRLEEAAPEHPAALYYAGLLLAATGRPDLAFPYWRRLVEDVAQGQPHRDMAMRQVGDLAWLAGSDWEPPVAAEGGDAAAQDEMIRGMVEGLASRLAEQGGPAEDWARLVTSLAVLGDAARAEAILGEAREVFAGDAEASGVLDRAAEEAGL